MPNRISQAFNQKKILVAYLTAGDGGIEKTLQAALALIAGGVSILEIGVPFSDPIADGPVIQRAATRALTAGTTLNDILWLVEKIREHSDIPLILFSYYNPILKVLASDFLARAQAAGIDGLLIVDCPIEETLDLNKACLAHDIAPIYVITPTTSMERIKKINRYARGFLYYACRKGITGIRAALPEDFAIKLKQIKLCSALPVVVGFGIAQAETVEQVLQHADGAVVGSLFVKALEDGKSPAELTQLTQQLLGNTHDSCIKA